MKKRRKALEDLPKYAFTSGEIASMSLEQALAEKKRHRDALLDWFQQKMRDRKG